jgi:hypothetical protein
MGAGTSFIIMNEVYGNTADAAAQQRRQRLANGFDAHPPLRGADLRFLSSMKSPLAYFSIPAEAEVASCYPSASDSETGPLLASATRQLGPRVWRHGMPEFDQGGGCWAEGRPDPAGLTDRQAYDAWTNFYLNTKKLDRYLTQTAQQRGYQWMSTCVFAFCPQYAYEMGSDLVLLERNLDETTGIVPGIAMLRGAARQHGDRPWGVDLSTWRYWNNGPTVYSSTGTLLTGWSPSTFKRTMYIAYMAGSNLIHNEAADYTTGGPEREGGLNPLGQAVQEFADFALNRHPDRGTPNVPVALMQDHFSGFEPRFGEWTRSAAKWYWKQPYTAGDTMFANLLDLLYPGHDRWGTIVPGAAWKVTNADGSLDIEATRAAYRAALAGGADPRPWEPMGSTRWGEQFDVITNRSSLEAMQRYKVVVLATGTTVAGVELKNLTEYVRQGGTLVLNAKQLGGDQALEALTGLHLTSGRASAAGVNWIQDNSTLTERAFDYSVVEPVTASVIAKTASGDPIVTKQALGRGAVYVTTPDYLQDASATGILAVGAKLLEELVRQFAVASVSGPQLHYLVNADRGRTIVTLVNTDLGGETWNGTVSFPFPCGSCQVREWTMDRPVEAKIRGGQAVVSASVPAYDVRVYAIDRSS